ncbi:MAG TPA: ABC-2 family transporter protein [Anaerolineaceae bacterium]|nr:ABC-2 family transporter protein [Anaerolineaceae bacterium]
MNFWRIFRVYFRLNALNELQYRANFFMQLFNSLLDLGFGLAGLALVFSYTDTLSGWTPAQLLVVMGVFTLITGLTNVFIQPNMARLIDGVGEGTLDFTLVKPEDSQLLVSVTEFQIWKLIDLVLGLIVLGVALTQLGSTLGIGQALLFVLVLLCGGAIVYCFWLMLATSAFWLIRVYEVLGLFESITQAGKWPTGIYPIWMRTLLTFLVPVAFAITVPAEALTGRLTWETLALTLGLTIAVALISRVFWKFGVRHYSGASA